MKALVTGGGGFLGSAIVRQLRARGDEVVGFSRGVYPELAALGVEQRRGDLADLEAVTEAARGCEIVFHVAAKAGVWGSFEAYRQANLVGTENVIAACRRNSIARLVYTSSPSVVFDGADMEGGNESLPYPAHFEAHYPHSKALAEQAVLAANSPSLATVSLRPHLIWGPADNHLVPRIVAKARAGKLRRIGRRPCLVDTVYVDNAAEAHLNAASRLGPGRQGLFHQQRRAVAALGDGKPHPGRGRTPPGNPLRPRKTRLRGGRSLRADLERTAPLRRAPDDPFPRQGAGHRPLVRHLRRPARLGLSPSDLDR